MQGLDAVHPHVDGFPVSGSEVLEGYRPCVVITAGQKTLDGRVKGLPSNISLLSDR